MATMDKKFIKNKRNFKKEKQFYFMMKMKRNMGRGAPAMSQIFLLTGFLGAGKTTLMKNLIQQLKDRRLHIIVNEFGREGVDGDLLRELGAQLDEIDNGSIFCSCRLDRFEEVLSAALDAGPDCILIEASGLADPTGVRQMLGREEYRSRGVYRGAICLVDAVRFEKVYETARCCKKQLAASDLILINKSDLAGPEQLERVRTIVQNQRPDVPVYTTVRGRVEPEWLKDLCCGRPEGKASHTADVSLQKHTLEVSPDCTGKQMIHILQLLAEDTYRMKGILRLAEGVYLADCVGTLLSLAPYEGACSHAGRLQILSGHGMPVRRAIRTALQYYPGLLREIKE